MKNKTKIILIFLALLATTAILYWPSLTNGFVTVDDQWQIIDNADIRALNLAHIKTIFTSFYVGMYQPLTTLTYAVDYHWFGFNNIAFHAVNLLLHLLNIILVGALAWLLFKNKAIALITAALFAIHPLNVQSVAWLSARSTLLFALFYLAALVAYAWRCQHRDKYYFYLFLTFIFFVLSLLSKAMALTLLPALLALDYYFQRRDWLKIILEKVPFALVAGIFAIITYQARDLSENLNQANTAYNFTQKILLVNFSALFYAIKAVIPFNLIANYQYPLSAPGVLPWYFYAAPLLTALILTLIGLAKKHRRLLIFSVAFYLLNLILIIRIIPISNEIVADRYAYLSILPIFWLAAWFIVNLPTMKIFTKKLLHNVFLFSCFLVFLFFCFLASRQIPVWHDDYSLWNNVLLYDQANPRAWLFRSLARDKTTDWQAALYDIDQSIALNPKISAAYNERATIKSEKLNDQAGALADYGNAIWLNNKLDTYYYNRALVYIKINDYKNAISDFSFAIALRAQPNYYFNRANAYYQVKKYPQALADYNQTVLMAPNFGHAYLYRGRTEQALNQSTAACADFQKAINLKLDIAKQIYEQNCQ